MSKSATPGRTGRKTQRPSKATKTKFVDLDVLVREKIQDDVTYLTATRRNYLSNVLKTSMQNPNAASAWFIIVVDGDDFVLMEEILEEADARAIAEEFNESTADFVAIAWPKFVPFPGKLEAC